MYIKQWGSKKNMERVNVEWFKMCICLKGMVTDTTDEWKFGGKDRKRENEWVQNQYDGMYRCAKAVMFDGGVRFKWCEGTRMH